MTRAQERDWQYVWINRAGKVCRAPHSNHGNINAIWVPPFIWQDTDAVIQSYIAKVETVMQCLEGLTHGTNSI